jgi:hypothetical protein
MASHEVDAEKLGMRFMRHARSEIRDGMGWDVLVIRCYDAAFDRVNNGCTYLMSVEFKMYDNGFGNDSHT